MKKLVLMMMVSCLPTMMMAQPAKYCMTYSDYKAHNWNTIESLVNGRSEMIPQIKMDESDIKVKSGDKEVDRILKKEVFAITFGKQLYVNCRNLRYTELCAGLSLCRQQTAHRSLSYQQRCFPDGLGG